MTAWFFAVWLRCERALVMDAHDEHRETATVDLHRLADRFDNVERWRCLNENERRERETVRRELKIRNE